MSATFRFSYRVLFFATLFIILALWGLHFGASGSLVSENQMSVAPEAKVSTAVSEAVQAGGKTAVVIALVDPLSAQQLAVSNLSTVRAEIAQAQARVLAAVTSADFETKYVYEAVPALAGNILTQAGLNQLAAHPDVRRIDLDVGGQGSLDVSVPLIGADDQHEAGITGAGVTVAVLDSGLDTDHTDLSGDLLSQRCFLDNDGLINGVGLCPNGSDRQAGNGAAEDGAGHGTHISGIITSDGLVSPIGVAPDAQIMAIKVLDNSSFSGTFYFFSEIVAALDYLINNQPTVQVINMSLGTADTFTGNCDNSTAYNMAGAAAINTLRANGVIAFASSGNNSSGSRMTSPACLSNVVSVGATTDNDVVASFTNSNSTLDIMAPGVGIISDALGNGVTSAFGTSMAAAHATGCAALLIQSGEATIPAQIEMRLKTSPVQVIDTTNNLTFPRIDCHPPPVTPTPTSTSTATVTVTMTLTPVLTITPIITTTTPIVTPLPSPYVAFLPFVRR